MIKEFIEELREAGFVVGYENNWHKVTPYDELSHHQRVTLSKQGQEISDYLASE